jgi:hypothetical protein
MAHDNLFREPEFAEGTPRPEFEEPIGHQYDVRAKPRRTTRRRTAA